MKRCFNCYAVVMKTFDFLLIFLETFFFLNLSEKKKKNEIFVLINCSLKKNLNRSFISFIIIYLMSFLDNWKHRLHFFRLRLRTRKKKLIASEKTRHCSIFVWVFELIKNLSIVFFRSNARKNAQSLFSLKCFSKFSYSFFDILFFCFFSFLQFRRKNDA
jgi:hypothetical protein